MGKLMYKLIHSLLQVLMVRD